MGYLSHIFNKFYNKRDVEIINEFRERLWKTLPYEKLDRKYTYKVSKKIEDVHIENILKEYSCIRYKVLKSRYKRDELSSEEYIKARINSNYGKYFDKDIYLGKQYYYQLANYKNIYFSYINGECDNVIKEIEENTIKVNTYKTESESKKIDLSWNEYKELVNGIIPKIFDNYIPMDKKIEEGEWIPNHNYDWDEDNYIIKYFNKYLDGEIKSYIRRIKREWTNSKKKCTVCGKEIILKSPNSNIKYCKKCAKEIQKNQIKEWKKKNIGKNVKPL